MMNETIDETIIPSTRGPESLYTCTRCISWSAIIVAALVAIGLNFLLYVLTTGIGLTAFTLNKTGQLSLVMGGFIWLILSSYFLMFLVGWIAGALARYNAINRCTGILHGFAAWCLALIVTVALFSSNVTSAIGTPVYTNYNTNYNVTTPAAAATEAYTGTTTGNTVLPNTVQEKVATNKLGIGVLALFFIFLSSALGSICGGYIGSEPTVCVKNEQTVRRTSYK